MTIIVNVVAFVFGRLLELLENAQVLLIAHETSCAGVCSHALRRLHAHIWVLCVDLQAYRLRSNRVRIGLLQYFATVVRAVYNLTRHHFPSLVR